MVAVITAAAFAVTALAWPQQQPQQAQPLAESESSTTSCIDNQPCNTTVTNSSTPDSQKSSTPDSQKSSTPDSQKSNHNKVHSSIKCMNNNQPCNTSAPNSTPNHTSASNPSTADSQKSNHNKVHSSIKCMYNNQPCNTSAPNSTASMPENYPPIEDEISSALDDLTG
jgi:hypothetical protein